MLMVTTSAGALGGGISSSVARALGAGRRDQANALVLHSLVLSSAVSMVFSVVVLLGGPWLYRAMGGDGPALRPWLDYSTVIFVGAPGVWGVNALASLWVVVNWLHADLPWLFATIALAFVVFGVAQALAVNTAIREMRA
jgi:Na+-driven multidrug efflux pump